MVRGDSSVVLELDGVSVLTWKTWSGRWFWGGRDLTRREPLRPEEFAERRLGDDGC